MVYEIVNEFQNVTKFNLLQYFEDYSNFMASDYASLAAYFAGSTSGVSASAFNNLNSLKSRGKNILQLFINFSSKLTNCGFCQLQQYCQDLYDTLEKIEKLPKYNRVTKTVRGYQPCIQVNGEIGGMKTIQDLAQEIDSIGVSELSLVLENDIEEDDWEIDKLSNVQAQVNNQTDVVVNTILEYPVGNHDYAKVVKRKISFSNNDIDVVKYEENVEQKCDILLSLNRGDVPELPAFGKNVQIGKNSGTYNYTELIKDLNNVFLQDDLFSSIGVESIELVEGDIYAKCSIKTKYSYSTVKSIKI